MKKNLLALLFPMLLYSGPSARAQTHEPAAEQTVTFRFIPGDDMFFIPWSGNGAELECLYSIIDQYRGEIISGGSPIYVEGYCSSGESAEASFRIAVTRSNRVKSELILNGGLLEEHFVTRNRATAWTSPDGRTCRDIVVATFRIPESVTVDARIVETAPEPVVAQEPDRQPEPEPEPEPEPAPQPEPSARVLSTSIPEPYVFAVRTNILYDAFLLPTLGVEWRVSRNVGIKVDGSYGFWGNDHGRVQKMWLVSPEVRWYADAKKRFYVGLGVNAGEANVYGFPVGRAMEVLFSDDTGYQGSFYGGGVTVGYQLYLSPSFSLDFNLGLGYTRFEYDTFSMVDCIRVLRGRGIAKNLWGPTQAGISLVWTMGQLR